MTLYRYMSVDEAIALFIDKQTLTTHLEDILEQEVDDRYFLKDDAVGRFLKANDTDNALFLQFDLPPTHEAAMFLKTYLQIETQRLGLWDKGIKACYEHLQMLSATKMYEQFKQSPEWMDVHYWRGFYKMYKENMERKKNEDK